MLKALFALLVLLAFFPKSTFATPLPIILTANLERTVCQEGKPVLLTLALHNGGTENLTIGGSAFEASSFQIIVNDQAGRAVLRTALGERVLTPPTNVSANYRIDLNPRQTLSYRFNLARLFDLSRAGEYTVHVSRQIPSFLMPRLPTELQSQETVLTAGAMKVCLVEAAAAYSGVTPLTRLPDHATFLYLADESYSVMKADGKISSTASVVSSFRVRSDGSISPTLNAPTFIEQGTGSVAATPDGRFLYVGGEKTVFQYHVGTDGVLLPLSPPTVPSQQFPGPLLMDPKGRFLYGMSSAGNTLYAIGQDGRLSVTTMIPFDEWAKNSEESVVPAGFGVLDSTGTLLYACNQSMEGYRLDSKGQVAAALGKVNALNQKFSVSLPPAEPDTAIAFTPSGHFAFMLAEKWVGPPERPTDRCEDVVVPMRVSRDGRLDPLLGPVMPRGPKGETYGCSNLVVDPTGHVLLLLNSQLDFIAPYRIGPDGSLTALKIMPHVGVPISVFFVPGNPLVYVLSSNPSSLLAFQLDDQQRLVPSGVDMPENEIPYTPRAAMLAEAIAPTPPKHGTVSGGLELSTWLGADVLPVVNPMVLTVILKNVTDRPLRLGTAGTDMSSFHLTFTGPRRQLLNVFRGDGEPVAAGVPLLAAGRDLLQSPRTGGATLVLPPGRERQYRFVLSRLADLTVAGHYTVQITRVLPSGAATASPIVSFRLYGPYNGLFRGGNPSLEVR